MKKLLILLTAVVALFSFVACGGNDDGVIDIYMPDGAPALVFAKMAATVTEIDGMAVNYSVQTGLDPLKAAVLNGSADIAVMPTNVAAALYTGGEKIRLLSVNVHGCLYIVSKGEKDAIESLADLKKLEGQTVYSVGRSGTPDLTFKKLLDSAGAVYSETGEGGGVKLQYAASNADILAKYLDTDTDEDFYSIFGEPFVTQLIARAAKDNITLKVAGNIQSLWGEAVPASGGKYPQASVIVRESFIKAHPGAVTRILAELAGGDAWLKDNLADAKPALKAAGSSALDAATAETVQRAGILFTAAADAKAEIEAYLNVLKDYSAPAVVGIPDDGFYYAG
jgi:NitT/TauT family transport system substrate-binding protein